MTIFLWDASHYDAPPTSRDGLAGYVHKACEGHRFYKDSEYGASLNAAAGAFLQQARDAGFTYAGIDDRIVGVLRKEAARIDVSVWQWRYSDLSGAPLADLDHDSANAESELWLSPPLGMRVALNHMTRTDTASTTPIAHMRLAYLYCDLGDQWLTEVDAFIASPPSPAGDRLSQAATYAARDAAIC